MAVKTSTEIEIEDRGDGDGRLIVHLYVNGDRAASCVYLSGPIADIRQFAADEINLAEVRRRWGFEA